MNEGGSSYNPNSNDEASDFEILGRERGVVDVDLEEEEIAEEESSDYEIFGRDRAGTEEMEVGCQAEDGDASREEEPDNYPLYTPEQRRDKQWGTVEEAENWYRAYARVLGFGVRIDHTGLSGDPIRVTRRILICHRQGKRGANRHGIVASSGIEQGSGKSKKRNETRCECQARCVIGYDKLTERYRVTEFKSGHNHEFMHPSMVHLHRSFRAVPLGDVETCNAMLKCGIKKTQCYEYIVNDSGGYEYTGFTSKDFYNATHKEANRRKGAIGGDTDNMLEFMREEKESDPGFYCRFGLDESGRLGNVFWRDSLALRDYSMFSDIFLFDSTYKTNKYGRPLVLFVGVNNHRSSVLFGAAILIDEKTETFEWALKTFMLSMGNLPQPRVVMTDGDDAMHSAVTKIFPEAPHRLCSWHVMKNVVHHITDPDIREIFRKCIYWCMSEAQFDIQWNHMVRMLEEREEGVSENMRAWLVGMYNKRQRWAEAFFRGHFFAMCKSTQRCEGLNNHLKRGLTRSSKIADVPEGIKRALLRIRNEVLKDDYATFNSIPSPITHMQQVEMKIANNLTKNVFEMARDNIKDEQHFRLVGAPGLLGGSDAVFHVHRYEREDQWRWMVRRVEGNYSCSCRLFESDGIPCAHIFCAMKADNVVELPDSLLHPRWSVTDRNDYSGSDRLQVGPDDLLVIPRASNLHSMARRICFTGALTAESYREVFKEFTKLVNKFCPPGSAANTHKRRHNPNPVLSSHLMTTSNCGVFLDPERQLSKKSKAAQVQVDAENTARAGNQCRLCKTPGHNARTCAFRTRDNPADAEEASNVASSAPHNVQSSQTSMDSRMNCGTGTTVTGEPVPRFHRSASSESGPSFERSQNC